MARAARSGPPAPASHRRAADEEDNQVAPAGTLEWRRDSLGVGAETVRRWPDAEIRRGLREFEKAVRRAPGGTVQDRGDRPPETAAAGGGRSDPRDPDLGA